MHLSIAPPIIFLIPLTQLHSCFVCNVVAAVSLLTEGRESRFVRRGNIPPVYLSCTMNYVLDDDGSGTVGSGSAHCPRIETYEPAIVSQQELCVEEAKKCDEVKWCLPPAFGCDWLGYFKHHFVLEQFFELWRGDDFVGTSKSRPLPARGLESFPCHSLHRSALNTFESDSKHFNSFGGCVVVFRHLAPNSQLFGVWFLWLHIEDNLLIVDLQNSNLSRSLQAAVVALVWDSPPMADVFFAPFKSNLFSLDDRKLPKTRRSTRSENGKVEIKAAKHD
jgi:hypothetical protein